MKRSARPSGSPAAGAVRTRRVVLLAAAGTEILDLVGPFQVFASATRLYAEQHPGNPPIYHTELVSLSRHTAFTTNCGLSMVAHRSFRDDTGAVDTLLVAGGEAVETGTAGAAVVRWLQRVAAGTRRVGSVCTGAFLLAQAGLLDGHRVTTHWNWCERLASRHPRVTVESDPIFVRDGDLYTSAGVTAGMDLALAMVEEDHGSRLALQVARHLVLYLRRPGGQSQFSAALALQAVDREPLRELHSWVLDNLHRKLSVQALAKHAAMSPRNFARVFERDTHTTPAKFVERLRVETARRRLEETRHTLKRIAYECGFGSVGTLRAVFLKRVGIPPGQYRRHFHGSRRA